MDGSPPANRLQSPLEIRVRWLSAHGNCNPTAAQVESTHQLYLYLKLNTAEFPGIGESDTDGGAGYGAQPEQLGSKLRLERAPHRVPGQVKAARKQATLLQPAAALEVFFEALPLPFGFHPASASHPPRRKL
jgi:hypothetical protein